MDQSVKLFVEGLSTFSLAAQQNAYPIIKSLRLAYHPSEKNDESNTRKFIESAKVVLNPISGWLEQEVWLVDVLNWGQTLTFPRRDLKFSFEKLFGLTEEVKLDLEFDVFSCDGVKLTST